MNNLITTSLILIFGSTLAGEHRLKDSSDDLAVAKSLNMGVGLPHMDLLGDAFKSGEADQILRKRLGRAKDRH